MGSINGINKDGEASRNQQQGANSITRRGEKMLPKPGETHGKGAAQEELWPQDRSNHLQNHSEAGQLGIEGEINTQVLPSQLFISCRCFLLTKPSRKSEGKGTLVIQSVCGS